MRMVCSILFFIKIFISSNRGFSGVLRFLGIQLDQWLRWESGTNVLLNINNVRDHYKKKKIGHMKLRIVTI